MEDAAAVGMEKNRSGCLHVLYRERGWKLVISRGNGFSSGLDPSRRDEADEALCLWRSVGESWPHRSSQVAPLSLGFFSWQRGCITHFTGLV